MRGAVPGEVGRTGAGDLLQPGERPADHLAVGEMAAANDAVDSLANQIDVTLAFADLQRNVRVAGEKLWQRGQQQGPRQLPATSTRMVPEMLPPALRLASSRAARMDTQR